MPNLSKRRAGTVAHCAEAQLPLAFPPPTTEPLTERELVDLAMLWGRLGSIEDVEILCPPGEELLWSIELPRLMQGFGRLVDEVGRLRGVIAAFEQRPAPRERQPAVRGTEG